MVTELNYPKDTSLKKCISKLKRESKFYVSPQGKMAFKRAIEICEQHLKTEHEDLANMFDARIMAQKVINK